MFISACDTNNTEETLVAEHAVASTQIDNLRNTATVGAARIETTLDFLGTRVRSREESREFMQSTLIARGTDADFLLSSLGGDAGTFLPLTATPLPTDPVVPVETPVGGQGGIVPPEVLTAQAAPVDGAAALVDITTASSVGADDCAQSPSSEFTLDTPEIYVVARAQNISAGTTLASRWLQEGAEVAAFDFAPDFDIENACIWFFIDQSDVAFVTGSWSVALDINGVQAASTDFSIVEQ